MIFRYILHAALDRVVPYNITHRIKTAGSKRSSQSNIFTRV